MTPIDWIAGACVGNVEMLKMHLEDFSDADLLVRPCPIANHAAWQLGHLVGSEAFVIGMVNPELKYDLPAGWKERFAKETSGNDDPKAFAGKAELIDRMTKARQTTVQWIKTLSADDLQKPGLQGRMASMAPTLGAVFMFLNGHVAMHTGQIQVIRRRLGKKHLF